MHGETGFEMAVQKTDLLLRQGVRAGEAADLPIYWTAREGRLQRRICRGRLQLESASWSTFDFLDRAQRSNSCMASEVKCAHLERAVFFACPCTVFLNPACAVAGLRGG